MTGSATMERPTLLIVDDEADVRDGLELVLRRQYRVLTADRAAAALRILATEPVDIVLSDHRMPQTTGLALLKEVSARYPDTIRIMLTGQAALDLALAAINQGEVYRFVMKPVDRTELKLVLFLACEKLLLEREVRALRAIVAEHPDLERSARLTKLRDRQVLAALRAGL